MLILVGYSSGGGRSGFTCGRGGSWPCTAGQRQAAQGQSKEIAPVAFDFAFRLLDPSAFVHGQWLGPEKWRKQRSSTPRHTNMDFRGPANDGASWPCIVGPSGDNISPDQVSRGSLSLAASWRTLARQISSPGSRCPAAGHGRTAGLPLFAGKSQPGLFAGTGSRQAGGPALPAGGLPHPPALRAARPSPSTFAASLKRDSRSCSARSTRLPFLKPSFILWKAGRVSWPGCLAASEASQRYLEELKETVHKRSNISARSAGRPLISPSQDEWQNGSTARPATSTARSPRRWCSTACITGRRRAPRRLSLAPAVPNSPGCRGRPERRPVSRLPASLHQEQRSISSLDRPALRDSRAEGWPCWSAMKLPITPACKRSEGECLYFVEESEYQ